MLEELLNINMLRHDGMPRGEFSPTELNSAMQLSIANFHATFDGRFRVDMAETLPGIWHAATLVRAIDNMIGNAFKYGNDSTPVTLRARQDERHTDIEVHNYGRTLSVEEQQRIFAPYERLADTNEKHIKTGGWGLGLSFVADVARAHGGVIAVRSDENQGTTFHLRIPNQCGIRAKGSVSTHLQSSKMPNENELAFPHVELF